MDTIKPAPNSRELIETELARLDSMYRAGEYRQFVALFNAPDASAIFTDCVGFEHNGNRYSFSEYACLDFRREIALLRDKSGAYENFTFDELKTFALWKPKN